jgi:hypothetical protein
MKDSKANIYDLSQVCEWRSKAIIILQLRYNYISIRYNLILSAMSILKTVSSYLLFIMSIINTLCHDSAQFCFTLCQY